VSDDTIRRRTAYNSQDLVFLDQPVGEIEKKTSFPRTSVAAERYLNSRYRRGLELMITIGLLVVLIPLFAIIGLGVKLSSPGPILFRQLRHGKGMQMFELVKFRSMYWNSDSDPGVKQAMRDDPRVTHFGRLLRCTSMDELPQLFSVLKGEMSLIGPRPHAIEHDYYYSALIPTYGDRFRARPGITGLAQVSGARGATPHIQDMKDRINLDMRYLQRASLMLDFRILLRTLGEIFASDRAF
jgi:putative colanic acid biosysnthesis UDP-glucose lipid carrier transferase